MGEAGGYSQSSRSGSQTVTDRSLVLEDTKVTVGFWGWA